jgi:acetyl esterase/lipase
VHAGRFSRGVGALLLVLTVPATANQPSVVHAATRYIDPTFNVDVQHDIVYGAATNVDGVDVTLTLDLYTPRGDTSMLRPVFVFAHGGFFAFGDKSEGSGWGNRLAQRGYVVASINYRLSSTLVVAPVDSDREVEEIDDARVDMQTSVRWLRVNAASLRIDPNKIAVGGVSAGAVTALGVAVNNDDPEVAEFQGVSSAVCTAVSYAGANDPQLVDAGDAGAIFHHGTADTIVPYDLAVQTRDAMIAHGLPVQWNEYAGDGHSLSADNQTTANARTIQWLADRVANATYPCSAAVAHRPRVPAGRQTQITSSPNRSAVVSLIAVDATAPGYAQLLPCGSTPGASSNLNLDRAGQTRSVLAVVRFDALGRSCVFNQPRTHLVVDQQGTFAAGAFDDIDDTRVLDTRTGPRLAAGSQTEISGRPDSTAVASLVVTDDTAAGYVQVLPCGATPGGSSNLNVDAPGQTRAGLVFIRFDAAGRACVYNQSPAHLIVDIQGYMAATAFDDIADTRLLDTRDGARPLSGSQTVLTGRPNSTAVVSLVATDTTAAGYVQALPCGDAPGSASNLNVDAARTTVAGLAFVHFDAAGHVCLFVQSSANLVADVQGYLIDGSFQDDPDLRLLDTR